MAARFLPVGVLLAARFFAPNFPLKSDLTLAPAAKSGALLFHLRKRAEFLAANSGKRAAMPGLNLQARLRNDDNPAIRVGFTCSKKVGNAVPATVPSGGCAKSPD